MQSCLPQARDELLRTFTLDSTTLATMFPFHSNSLSMPGGVLVGVSETHEPVLLNPWDASLENPHLFIGGVTGSGKSYLGKLLVEFGLRSFDARLNNLLHFTGFDLLLLFQLSLFIGELTHLIGINPFVFVRAVRAFFDGPLVLAGGITDGHALRAAQALGCDLAYMGTKFIATRESMADARYKELLVASSADDVLLTTAFTGLQTNMLRPSIEAAGLDPDNLPLRGAIDIGKDIDIGARESRPKRWKDIWSAGHSVSGVTELLSVDELVARTSAEFREAAARVRLD